MLSVQNSIALRIGLSLRPRAPQRKILCRYGLDQRTGKNMMKTSRGTGLVYRPTYVDKGTGERKAASTWWIQYSVRGR